MRYRGYPLASGHGHCPASRKTSYRTAREAASALAFIAATAVADPIPVRAYCCSDCGCWHLTKLPLWLR